MQLKDLLGIMSNNNIKRITCHAGSSIANSEICKICSMPEEVYASHISVNIESLKENDILMNSEIYIRDIYDNEMLIELY